MDAITLSYFMFLCNPTIYMIFYKMSVLPRKNSTSDSFVWVSGGLIFIHG